MVEVVLHIGGEKTGSTSIQASLKSSRARLAEQGVLYPAVFGDSNHVGLYVYASRGGVDELKSQLDVTTPAQLAAFRDEVRAGLRAEAAAVPGLRKLVVSNEHLSGRLKTELEMRELRRLFLDVFGAAEFRLVYFARPQWELIPSFYSTYVKTGGLNKLVYPMSEMLHHKLQHLQIVEQWQQAFPDAVLDVHPFSTADGTFDVVKAFAGIAGIAYLDEVVDQNVSLSAPAIELMRIFNRHVPRSVAGKFNPVRGNIQQLLEAQGGPALEIPPSLQGRIAAEFAADNARLNALFGREIVPSPAELIRAAEGVDGQAETEVPIALDVHDAVRMLGECFTSKQEQFAQAKARVDALNRQVQDLRQARQEAAARAQARAAARAGDAKPGKGEETSGQ